MAQSRIAESTAYVQIEDPQRSGGTGTLSYSLHFNDFSNRSIFTKTSHLTGP
jgi:hypothetical protein